MEGFEFYSPTRFVFGRDAEKKTGALVKRCGVGRIQDWASHGIEHELSAMYDCAHGAGLALVASLHLNGNTIGAFKALTEADVETILTSCVS